MLLFCIDVRVVKIMFESICRNWTQNANINSLCISEFLLSQQCKIYSIYINKYNSTPTELLLQLIKVTTGVHV